MHILSMSGNKLRVLLLTGDSVAVGFGTVLLKYITYWTTFGAVVVGGGDCGGGGGGGRDMFLFGFSFLFSSYSI